MEKLAQRYYVSRAKLVYDFKNHSGMTINEYLSLIRINNAKNIPEQGSSVGEASLKCSYISLRLYFGAAICEIDIFNRNVRCTSFHCSLSSFIKNLLDICGNAVAKPFASVSRRFFLY